MRFACAAVLMAGMSASAWAGTELNIACNNSAGGCQSVFESATRDLTATLNYKALEPAEATGLLGVGVGAFATYTPVHDKNAWRELTGSDVDFVGMAGLQATKGLPFGFDVGAFYTWVPDTSAKAFGAQLRYAILEGGVATPALALRGAFTRTSGIDDFDFTTRSVDLSLSKGFAMVTPYIGAGYVWGVAKPGDAVATAAGLSRAKADEERFFLGVRLSMLLLEVTPEFERVGSTNAYNLRLGMSF
ncbi:hypothetical protein [Sinimarinibacterium sp. NLF-5-8]|uniref:hypothetical protein n=1 Tax=Sinimarinibacterium sp. NLF-5-8 TaxID=2698684 RepID=UPI00137BD00F|nr:hypothetical protein [Sinimarinibacterium sp. NLF-5-8]QHS08802.1 hypothetical protein GT972_00700 [Sinimarinibacterium sp. NLF-5-8]